MSAELESVIKAHKLFDNKFCVSEFSIFLQILSFSCSLALMIHFRHFVDWNGESGCNTFYFIHSVLSCWCTGIVKFSDKKNNSISLEFVWLNYLVWCIFSFFWLIKNVFKSNEWSLGKLFRLEQVPSSTKWKWKFFAKKFTVFHFNCFLQC